MKLNSITKQLAVALIATATLATVSLAEDMKDCVMMKGGTMMVCKKMDKDMKMGNGTVVMKDGTCIMGEKKMKMKEGDMMDMDGNMMEQPGMSGAKMKQQSE